MSRKVESGESGFTGFENGGEDSSHKRMGVSMPEEHSKVAGH